MANLGGNITLDANTTIEIGADAVSLLVRGTNFPFQTVLASLTGQVDNFRLQLCRNIIMATRAAPVALHNPITAIHTYITNDQYLNTHLEDQIRAYIYPRDPTDPNRPTRDRAFLYLHHQRQFHLRRYGTTPISTIFPQAAATRKNDLRRALWTSVGTDRAKAFIKSAFPLYVTREQIPPNILGEVTFILDKDRFQEASRIDPSLSQDILAIQDTAAEQKFNSFELIRREELRFKLQLALSGLSLSTLEGWRSDDWIDAFRQSEPEEDSDRGTP